MKDEKAVIVLNHGTRNIQAQEGFVVFVQTLKERFSAIVIEHASMELSEPRVSDVIKKLYESGTRNIAIVPFFRVG